MANGETAFQIGQGVAYTLEAICRQLIQAKALDGQTLITVMLQLQEQLQNAAGATSFVPDTLIGLLQQSKQQG